MQIINGWFYSLLALFIGLSPFTHHFTEGVTGQPTSFLPSKAISKNDQTISQLIFRSLFTYDIYGGLTNDLADSYEISEDGLVYTIRLKDNQYWSNGKKISADDLIYTSFKIQNLSGVGTDKIDDLTVRYTLPNKYSPFLSLLTVGVMPENSEEKEDPLFPVTSGPFKIIRIERDGQVVRRVTLVNTSKDVKIKKLNFRFYANEEELEIASKLGEIDGFYSLSKKYIQGYDEYTYPLQSIYYSLYFNLRNEKYQDLAFRQAMAKVLPLDKMISEYGINVEGPISRNPFTDKSLDFNYFDKTFVGDMSDKVVTITYPALEQHRTMAKKIKEYWEDALLMEVRLNEVDSDKILDQVIVPRDFEILLYGQAIGRDPDRYVNWHSTQKDAPGLNLSGFEQVRADRALEEGRNEYKQEGRPIHYDQFQKAVYEQVPVIFLYHSFLYHYVNSYVTGVGEKYTFLEGDRFLDFHNWERIKTN